MDNNEVEVQQNEIEVMEHSDNETPLSEINGLTLPEGFNPLDLLNGMPLKEEGFKSKDSEPIYDDLPSFDEISKKIEQEGPEMLADNTIEIPDEALEAKPEETEEEPVKEEKAEENQQVEAQELELKDFISKLPDEKIKVKIDGEYQVLSSKDVLNKYLNDYSGQVLADKRFSELDKSKKEFIMEKQEINNYLENFGKMIKDGNVDGALEYFGQFANLPGHVIKEHLFARMLPQLEKRYAMSHEQVEAEKLKQENEYLRNLKESELRRREGAQAEIVKQQQLQERTKSINSIRETHKLTEQEWNNAFKELDSTLPQGQQITLSMVKDHALSLKTFQHSAQMVEKSLSKMGEVSEETKAYMLDVARKHPEFTQETYDHIVAEALKSVTKNEIESSLADKAGKQKVSNSEVALDTISKDYIRKLLEGED